MRAARARLCLLAAGLLVGPACGAQRPAQAAPDLAARLQRLLDERVGRGGVQSAILRVEAPERGLRFEGAAGFADPATSLRARADDRFRSASVTKTFMAALVLQLAEQGRLGLDEPLARRLPAALLARVHVLGGHAYGPELTPRQLLGHTSGLGDPRNVDTDEDGVADFVELLLARPDRQWTPLELVEWAAEHVPPQFAPGRGFHYSDVNYQLLGLLIEASTGRSLAQVYRERLLAPLGLADTHLEAYEPPAAGQPASHAFEGDLDTAPFNVSWEWAAGGLVSSAADLTRFARALFEDGLLRPESLLAMQAASASSAGRYGLGLDRELVEGELLMGHSGYWGVFMYYWPARRTFICGTLNQSRANTRALLRDVVVTLR